MNGNIYQSISVIGFSLAALFFMIAIILFLKFDVISLIGELSGREAKKQVQAIRERNKNSSSEKKIKRQAESLERPSKQVARNVFEIPENNTMFLDTAFELNNETEVLSQGKREYVEGTTLLSQGGYDENTVVLNDSIQIIMLQDDVEIHTDEII